MFERTKCIVFAVEKRVSIEIIAFIHFKCMYRRKFLRYTHNSTLTIIDF